MRGNPSSREVAVEAALLAGNIDLAWNTCQQMIGQPLWMDVAIRIIRQLQPVTGSTPVELDILSGQCSPENQRAVERLLSHLNQQTNNNLPHTILLSHIPEEAITELINRLLQALRNPGNERDIWPLSVLINLSEYPNLIQLANTSDDPLLTTVATVLMNRGEIPITRQQETRNMIAGLICEGEIYVNHDNISASTTALGPTLHRLTSQLKDRTLAGWMLFLDEASQARNTCLTRSMVGLPVVPVSDEQEEIANIRENVKRLPQGCNHSRIIAHLATLPGTPARVSMELLRPRRNDPATIRPDMALLSQLGAWEIIEFERAWGNWISTSLSASISGLQNISPDEIGEQCLNLLCLTNRTTDIEASLPFLLDRPRSIPETNDLKKSELRWLPTELQVLTQRPELLDPRSMLKPWHPEWFLSNQGQDTAILPLFPRLKSISLHEPLQTLPHVTRLLKELGRILAKLDTSAVEMRSRLLAAAHEAGLSTRDSNWAVNILTTSRSS